MKSRTSGKLLDLDHDVPTTGKDLQQLKKIRLRHRQDPKSYLEFLEQFPPPSPATLRARRGPRGTPFELA